MTSLILTPPHALVVQAVKAYIHGRIVMHEILKHPLTQKYFPIGLLLADERELLRNASLLCNFNCSFSASRSLGVGAINYELVAKVVGRPWSHRLRAPVPNNDKDPARHNREKLGHVLGT